MLKLDVRLARGSFTLEVALAAGPGVLALFGRSGCGKTTLVNVIAGLLAGATGRIEMDGATWLDSGAGIHVPAERRRVGYVFQDARLFPHYDVRGNLRYGARRARGLDGPQALAFDDVIALLGLSPLLDRHPRHLSGGERQRVALGRALLSRPRLLLLDEPLAAIDAARRDDVLPYLEGLRDACGIPMIFVSHRFDEVLRLATEVAVLDDGRLTAQGTPHEVSLSPAVRAIVGPDEIGSVVTGPVVGVDADGRFARLAIGNGELTVALSGARPGESRRVQLLARDIIVALEEPRDISVRNRLRGVVREIVADADSDLIHIDVGNGSRVLARITHAATTALALEAGKPVWALVKAVSTRGHAY